MSATRTPTLIALALAVLASAMAYLALSGGDAGSAPLPAEPSTSDEPTAPELATLDGAVEDEPPRSALPVTGRVRGTVVHAKDGAPFAGVVVRLVAYRETRAETASDADGTFDLPWLEGTGRAVEVVPPAGFDTRDRRERLRGEGPPEPIRFELARDSGVPVVVRVVDAFDGSPQAHLPIVLEGPKSATRRATSDSDGVARLDETWEPGRVTVAPAGADRSADRDSSGTFAHGEGDGLASVEVHLGPTFELELSLPESCDPASLAAWLEAEAWPRAVNPDERQPLHAGPPPWVRFTRTDLERAGAVLPRRLVVASKDGLWAGFAPVSSSAGRSPEPVAIALESRGALRLYVQDSAGQSLPKAKALLRTLAGHVASERVRESDDAQHFEFLPAGAYELTVTEPSHEASLCTIVVELGRIVERKLRLQRRPGGGLVEGEVRSSSGRSHVTNWVTIFDPSTGDVRVAEVRWSSTEAPAVGRFAFEDVPAGAYELTADKPGAGQVWDPPSIRVEPPASGLSLTLIDDGPLAWLEFTAVERGTGRPIQDPDLKLGLQYEGASSIGVLGGNTISAGLQRTDQDLRWRLTAEGYLPANGTLADLAPKGKRGDIPVRHVRVELEPGWDAVVVVWNHEAGRISGALVLIDGQPAGTTDEFGLLFLRRDALPRRLRIEVQGWRPVEWTGAFEISGQAADWEGPATVDVRLERP